MYVTQVNDTHYFDIFKKNYKRGELMNIVGSILQKLIIDSITKGTLAEGLGTLNILGDGTKNGDWRLRVVDNLLHIERYNGTTWVVFQTLGASVLIPDFLVMGKDYSAMEALGTDDIQRNIWRRNSGDVGFSFGNFDSVIYQDVINRDSLKMAYPTVEKILNVYSGGTTNEVSVGETPLEYTLTITPDESLALFYFKLSTNDRMNVSMLIREKNNPTKIVYQTESDGSYDIVGGVEYSSSNYEPLKHRATFLIKNIEYEIKVKVKGEVNVGIDGGISYPNLQLKGWEFKEEIISTRDFMYETFEEAQKIGGFVEEPTLVCNEDSLTITGDFNFYINSNKFSKTGFNHNILATNLVQGNNYIYFNNLGNVISSNSISLHDFYNENCPIAIVYVNTSNKIIYCGKETHSTKIASKMHEYLHKTVGTRYESGLGLFGFTSGDGSSDAHFQFKYDGGIIWDEDLSITIPSSNNTYADIPIFYKINQVWNRKKNSVPLIGKNDVTVTTRPKINVEVNGQWELQEVGVNDYFLTHFFAINDVDNPIIGICGINKYQDAVSAKNASATEINSLTGLPFAEFAPIASVLYKTDSYTNTANAVWVAVDGGDYVDFRKANVSSTGSGGVQNHADLTGLSADGVHPSSSISVSTTNFNKNLNNTFDTVQKVCDYIDDLDNVYDSNLVDNYEDATYIYSVAGVDNNWYSERMQKASPNEITKHISTTTNKPTTLGDVQNLVYGVI